MLLDASSCSMFIFQCSIFDSISSSFFRIDILMSAEKNVLKLTRDHMDFNLNLKTILSPLFDAQKSVYTKKKTIIETFDILVSFVPSDISIWHEIQGEKG